MSINGCCGSEISWPKAIFYCLPIVGLVDLFDSRRSLIHPETVTRMENFTAICDLNGRVRGLETLLQAYEADRAAGSPHNDEAVIRNGLIQLREERNNFLNTHPWTNFPIALKQHRNNIAFSSIDMIRGLLEIAISIAGIASEIFGVAFALPLFSLGVANIFLGILFIWIRDDSQSLRSARQTDAEWRAVISRSY